ncbi:MAG: type II toxin-antitoxin system PemK/MazF family toxin [Candidatus Lokiarchaeota archaeon]|nr:type II toxin-antitoxin system PemK/MazF family toxin [Candidatus Harpocratesius repetitus]
MPRGKTTKKKRSDNDSFCSGDVILATIQFTDTAEIKIRPAVVLFGEFDNLVIAGITSNTNMEGIPLSIEEGAIKPSVIKLNYIFTISTIMVRRKLFSLSRSKKLQIYNALLEKLSSLSQVKKKQILVNKEDMEI